MDKCRFCNSVNLVNMQGSAGRGKNRIHVTLEYCADCGFDQAKDETKIPKSAFDMEFEDEMSRAEQNFRLPEDKR